MRILLREARKARKLTQKQLSERSGVTERQIQHIECGETNPTFRTMCRLAAALRMDPWEIFRMR